ncbi:asparagine synthase-related protein [Blastomonas sp.]|uniref:asparagine synthase-related protein n=1 Tax=Blastomonas sp. TaxID=1909299 RepID=UPI00391ADC38
MAGHFRIELSSGSEAGAGTDPTNGCPAFVDPAVRVWSDTPVIRIGDHGCIIGHLFERVEPSRRITTLDDVTVQAILASEGRSLLTDFWGAYVAVLVGDGGTVSVLRDPSGQLPCYYQSKSDSLTLGSDVEDLATRGSGAVNFEQVGRLLISLDAIGRDTCLVGISELLAGECITRSTAGTSLRAWWTPWRWTDAGQQIHFDAAAAKLRRVTINCVRSWGGCFESILLGVSGGLDSSIVACAVQLHTMLHCLNLVSNDPHGDERSYAARLATVLDRPLHERHYALSSVDVEEPVAPHHPWPVAPYLMQSIAAIHSQFRDNHYIEAHFSGNGGDNVFCSLHTAAPFVDRFLSQGSRSGIMTTLRDLSVLTGADGMTILRHAWDIYRRAGHTPRIASDTSGLSRSFIETLVPDRSLHPWLDAPKDALPGKIGHVKQLIRAQRSIELYPRKTHPIHIAPLLSQPIIELCLAIPTWLWVNEGKNRAVARAAFEGIVPKELLQRTSKGGPSGFMREIYQSQGRKAEDMLRGGMLAKTGMLDLSIFDGAGQPTPDGSNRARRILTLCAAETWARWWNSAI